MTHDARTTRQNRAAKASAAYMYSWMVVAAGSLAYVGVAMTRPDVIASILPIAETAAEQSGGGRVVADLADEIASMRKWIHDMQHELAATRGAVQEQNAHTAQLLQRIASAEERIAVLREARAEVPPARGAPQKAKGATQALAPETPAPAQQQVVSAAPAGPGGQDAARAASADVANVRVINPNSASAPIVTGSVAPPVPAAVPKQAVQGAPRGIEIASADSLEDLRTKWGDIAGRNPDVVGDLSPRYRLSTDGRRAPFALVAGPFASTAEAAKTCAALKAKGVVCRVSDFAGSAF